MTGANDMIDKELEKLYFKFRNNYCKNLFSNVNNDKDGLSPTDSYCIESIFLMNRPTVRQFANYVKISQPNATYRISNLIEKGYIRKILSQEDRREYFLEVTDKFFENYGINSSSNIEFLQKIYEKFTEDEIEKLDELLCKINNML